MTFASEPVLKPTAASTSDVVLLNTAPTTNPDEDQGQNETIR